MGDRVQVRTDGEDTAIVVTRGSGIGRADVILKHGTWPARLKLEFRSFETLESLAVGYENRCHLTALVQAPKARLAQRLADGTCREMPDILSPYQFPMRRTGDGIVVELPPEMFKVGNRRLGLEWIDAYRQ